MSHDEYWQARNKAVALANQIQAAPITTKPKPISPAEDIAFAKAHPTFPRGLTPEQEAAIRAKSIGLPTQPVAPEGQAATPSGTPAPQQNPSVKKYF
jgi:hypothetical protein